MISGEGNENSQNKSVGLIRKKKTLHGEAHFFIHFFAVVLHDHNVKLGQKLPSHKFYGPGEMLYVFLFPFFRCHSFSPRWPLQPVAKMLRHSHGKTTCLVSNRC